MGGVVRELADGPIRGESLAEGRVAQFLGVPYGGTVDGAGRFRPSGPVDSWAGVFDAKVIGAAAPHTPMTFASGARGERMWELSAGVRSMEPQGENCLVLNAWEPTWSTSTDRPVMVSLHGGGHTFCSGSMPAFDGAALASQHDVVVVSVNHRLGALGYLYLADVLDDETLSANVGMLDLVAALHWVKVNAAVFGGDSSNVTIFGESGGGSKVSTLMVMPAAAGLFHRAIVQSGAKLKALSPENAAAITRALLDELDLAANPAGIFDVPAVDVVAAQTRVLGGPAGSPTRTFGPVVDGEVLPRHPFDPDAPPVSAAVPLLIGTTKDEAAFFAYSNESLDTIDDEGAVAALAAMNALTVERARALYDVYCGTRPDLSPTRRFTAVWTDRLRVAAIRQAERKAAARGAPVWMYRFDFETDVEGGALGAPHAVDVAYTFGNADACALSGSRPERHNVATTVSRAWASFARHGSPNTPDLPDWAPYDDQQRTTMLLDAHSHSVHDPDPIERAAWADIAIETF